MNAMQTRTVAIRWRTLQHSLELSSLAEYISHTMHLNMCGITKHIIARILIYTVA